MYVWAHSLAEQLTRLAKILNLRVALASCSVFIRFPPFAQDPDTYKQYVKEQISNFAAHFPDSQDYMIVYVTTQDPNKQKTQFKLRGSAFDRIKADFGAKSDLYAI